MILTFLVRLSLILPLLVVAKLDTAVRRESANNTTPYSIPQFTENQLGRAASIFVKREGYLYGPSLMGTTAPFPNGTLGTAMVQRDVQQWTVENANVVARVTADAVAARNAIAAAGGFRVPDDYSILYVNQWRQSVPDGQDAGALTNYTSDLFFSMQRLSINPYSLRRLKPNTKLPFNVNNTNAQGVSSMTLAGLLAAGRLFYIDYSYQAKYLTTPRYTAYCDAYFYIHPASGDFLPLAIRTNTGSNLIYTPADSANDWLLAKIMFEVNDLLHAQVYHLVNEHVVGEAVHQAALRTLSDCHPVMAILNRLMYGAYAVRPAGQRTLLDPGAAFDQFFAVSGAGTQNMATDLYNGPAGNFVSNYMQTDLTSRGLLNSRVGPALKSFPFYEDALPIRDALFEFFTSFVNSYYSNDLVIVSDVELQGWLQEAARSAEVHDFPPAPIRSKKTLVEILTHFAFMTGASHHVLNTGELSAVSAILPLHPTSLYAPVPAAKGIASIMPFLPPAAAALGQMNLISRFNRPQYKDTNATTLNMFNDRAMLGRMNTRTSAAEDVFRAKMARLSQGIRARVFDDEGLCQGMPLVWRGLDPGTIPYFFAI